MIYCQGKLVTSENGGAEMRYETHTDIGLKKAQSMTRLVGRWGWGGVPAARGEAAALAGR